MDISELGFNLLQKEYIQLTLEQYGFELYKSTYTWIFFNKYTVGPLYSWDRYQRVE